MSLTRRQIFSAPPLIAAGAFPSLAHGRPPQGYPRSYSGVVAAAAKEGELLVYGNTDLASLSDLLTAFRLTYPKVKARYVELAATPLSARYAGEIARGAVSADLVWSSAMDLQAKLINDGYAQAYASPEKPNLPPWAVWKNEAWGVTAEPIVIAYNKKLLPPHDVPRSHEALERLLRTKSDLVRGKVSTYDPIQSGVGFLYISQDVRISRDTWKLLRALGKINPKLYTSTGSMISKLETGEHLISYNAIGSYVMERAKQNPEIGLVFPSDYTQVMSRIAFISKDSRNPNAARLFLDFLLSLRGQKLLARRSLGPVRNDLVVSGVPAPAPNSVQAVRVGPGLLANLDQIKRAKFLRDWTQALGQT